MCPTFHFNLSVRFTFNCYSKYSGINVKLIYSFFYCNFYIGLYMANTCKVYTFYMRPVSTVISLYIFAVWWVAFSEASKVGMKSFLQNILAAPCYLGVGCDITSLQALEMMTLWVLFMLCVYHVLPSYLPTLLTTLTYHSHDQDPLIWYIHLP